MHEAALAYGTPTRRVNRRSAYPSEVIMSRRWLVRRVIWESLRRSIMDTDLEQMSREQLIEEVKKLRQGIRQHRDSSGHELCWHHPDLWGLLPEKADPVSVVPKWPQF